MPLRHRERSEATERCAASESVALLRRIAPLAETTALAGRR
ncbi:hypothetical protein AU375_04285 [Methylobacterium radiotolerans]|nr:hypothetical protein AU375_04285 [Methylobacterium radiotolerans]